VKGRLKLWVRSLAGPVGCALARLGISADVVTLLGVAAAVVAAWGLFADRRWIAFAALFASGLMDLLDGAVARAGGRRGTPFGAALDSALDRYGEGLILCAILARLALDAAPPWLLALAALSSVGSFMVSYVRARSEGLGIPCEVGLLERPERLLLLLVLSLWGRGGWPWILGLLALLTHVTFLQRLFHVRRESLRRTPGPERGSS
jgi:CDP-diacylglycerol--glycerol-3-phosphate 3-phosphatidyltransferase